MPFTEQAWSAAIAGFAPDRLALIRATPELAGSRTRPDRLIDIVVNQTRHDPIGPVGLLAHSLLDLHFRQDRPLAVAVCKHKRVWARLCANLRRLVKRASGLGDDVGAISVEVRIDCRCGPLTAQLVHVRAVLRVLEKAFNVAKPPERVCDSMPRTVKRLLEAARLHARVGDTNVAAFGIACCLSVVQLAIPYWPEKRMTEIPMERIVQVAIRSLIRLESLAARERDRGQTSCWDALAHAADPLYAVRGLSERHGLIGVVVGDQRKLIRRAIACVCRPYDKARPESRLVGAPAAAARALVALAQHSARITDLIRAEGAHALIGSIPDFIARARAATPTDASYAHGTVSDLFAFVHTTLLTDKAERDRSMASPQNPFALAASLTVMVINPINTCDCSQERLVVFLGEACRLVDGAGDGSDSPTPSLCVAALVGAIEDAMYALATVDKAAARDPRRRQLIRAWRNLALAAGLDTDPATGSFCSTCGRTGAKLSCARCAAPFCASASSRWHSDMARERGLPKARLARCIGRSSCRADPSGHRAHCTAEGEVFPELVTAWNGPCKACRGTAVGGERRA